MQTSQFSDVLRINTTKTKNAGMNILPPSSQLILTKWQHFEICTQRAEHSIHLSTLHHISIFKTGRHFSHHFLQLNHVSATFQNSFLFHYEDIFNERIFLILVFFICQVQQPDQFNVNSLCSSQTGGGSTLLTSRFTTF